MDKKGPSELRSSMEDMLEKAEASGDQEGATQIRATLRGMDGLEKLRAEAISNHEPPHRKP